MQDEHWNGEIRCHHGGHHCVVYDTGIMTLRLITALSILLLVAACSSQSSWNRDTHIVRKGETLFSIAWRYGKNTEDAISCGLYYCAIGMLEEVTRRYADKVGRWPHTVLTGAAAEMDFERLKRSVEIQL